jgi:sugar phosphate isomerase/epimerase
MPFNRRTFLAGAGAAVAQTLASAQRPRVELGAISGSVSQTKWTPVEFLDYLSKIDLRHAMISLPRDVLLDEAAVKRVRAHADKLGISLILAHGSVCPSSKSFNASLGTVEEQVAPALRASQIFGARSMRCVLGSGTERPEIDMHIENMLRAVRGMRTRILDSGVKLAVENHGGDLQARELKALVEAAGRDIMGVCLDSGNPVWMLEDPHMTLEMLGPYAETSHLRDSAVWRVPEGIAVRWVNMGDGNVDIDGWIAKFIAMRPGLPLIFENLVSRQPRIFSVFDPKFWDSYRKMPAWEFSRFLALAERGKPTPAIPATPGKDPGRQQCEDLEVCVRHTRELLRTI